jgi:hypothetical protein
MFMIDLGAQSHYSTLGVSPSAGIQEIRDAFNKIGNDLKKRLIAAKTEEEKKKIEERQKQINSIGGTLISPERRAEYDRENAHLRFFDVQTIAAPLFTSKTDRLHVLHRAIRDFLGAKGVALAPLSDLEREDFASDENRVELLDNLLW